MLKDSPAYEASLRSFIANIALCTVLSPFNIMLPCWRVSLSHCSQEGPHPDPRYISHLLSPETLKAISNSSAVNSSKAVSRTNRTTISLLTDW